MSQTKAQREFANNALVRNLLFKFPQLSNYDPALIVESYDSWLDEPDNLIERDEDKWLEYFQTYFAPSNEEPVY